MAITRELPDDQDWIIDLMQQMGFTSDDEGVCLGIGIMGAQAIQVGELSHFEDRLESILSLSQSNLFLEAKINILNRIKANNPNIQWEIIDLNETDIELNRLDTWEKINDALNLFNNRDEVNKKIYNDYIKSALAGLQHNDPLLEKVNDLNAFFTTIEIIYSAEKYREFLPASSSKPSEIIFDKALLSAKMEKLGGFISDKPFCRAFNKNSLLTALDKLTEILVKENVECPITLIINSFKHHLTVTYSPFTHKWLMINANELSVRDITLNRTNSILQGLSNNNFAVCAIIPTYPAIYQNQLEEKINDWKKFALNNGSNNPRHKDSNGYNSFLLSCMVGDTDEIKNLLKNGLVNDMNIDYNQNSKGLTGIATAAYSGHADIVKILLDHNANPNFSDKDGDTPLTLAIQANHPECVKILMDYELTQTNTENNYGESPLYLAIKNDNVEIVKLLLTSKKDFSINYKILEIAKETNHPEILSLLEQQNTIKDQSRIFKK